MKIGLDHHQIDLLILVYMIQPHTQALFPFRQIGLDFKQMFLLFCIKLCKIQSVIDDFCQ